MRRWMAGEPLRAGAVSNVTGADTLRCMEDWVDTITFGNVAQVKTVLATVVLCLAVYQVVLMSVGYDVLKPGFLKPKAASFAHRAVGDTIVPIALLIAWMCVSYFEVGDGIEHAAYGETTRAAIHVMAGSAFVGVLAIKVVIVRWFPRLHRFLPHLGIAVLLLFVVTWVSSAGDYLVEGNA